MHSSTFSAVRRTALSFAVPAITAFGVLAAFWSPPAVAYEPSSSVRAGLDGIDLSSADGMILARERLHQAARKACFHVADEQDISHRSNFVACVDAAFSAALQQLDSVSKTRTAKN